MAGATGYTGREVVAELRAQGAETYAHVRPDSSALPEWKRRFEALGAQVDVTPWERVALTETFRRTRPTHLFALLGTTRARARAASAQGLDASAQSYEAVDYGLTALLLEAALAAGARPRFVYLSAVGVTDGSSNPYLAVRARLERELKASGLPFVIVRPSFITGADRDERRPAERFAALASDGLLGVLGALGARTLRDRYRSIDAKSLARGLVRVALEPGAEGRTVLGEELR